MTRRLDRRAFLRLSAYTVAAASAPIACGEDDGYEPDIPKETVDAVFPQGIASGDPRPDSVILWTRVTPLGGLPEEVQLELAMDEAFTQMLPLEGAGLFAAVPEADHTVRVKVTKLAAYTTYYYRFTARGVTSPVGRTKTAPAPDQDVPVKIAFASCQDFVGRYYHAWASIADEDIDFVLHLGDYVYETTGDPRFQETVAPRRKITLPDGMTVRDFQAALTLRDYRALYRQYRSDPDLRRVHARFPFVCIWDDHEFSDDSWGDHGTYFSERNGDEKDTARRHAANRAWYEYQPADVMFDDAAPWPQDIQIHRSLRYGKHVELFLLDERTHRDDHLIPEGPKGTGALVYKGEYDSVGARHFVLKSEFDAREAAASPPPTLLGSTQKAWLLSGVSASQATWKLVGSQVPLAQMTVNLAGYEIPPPYNSEFYVTVDPWDGYRTERAEILGALRDVPNLVTLCGDIHAFYANQLRVDPDDPQGPVAAVEFTCAGISSGSLQEEIGALVNSSSLFLDLGLDALVPQLDNVLQTGTEWAKEQFVYARSRSNGIALAEITASGMAVEFRVWEPETILVETYAEPAAIERFTVAAGQKRIVKES